jgi:hypothetical protein
MTDALASLAAKLASAASVNAEIPLEDFCERRLQVGKEEGGLTPFKLRSIQKIYLSKKRQAIREGKPAKFILLKYRRGGFTTLEQAAHYQMVATKPRHQVATLSQSIPSTTKISQIAKTFKEMDPLLPGKERDESNSLNFKHTNSTFTIGTAGGTAFGRGDTLQRVHCSEVAFWLEGPNQDQRISTLIAGLTEAARAGEIVLESTPNGINWFAHTFMDAQKGINDWTPIFLPWFADPTNRKTNVDFEEILDTVTDEERHLIKTNGLTVEQIAWRRDKIKSLGRLFFQEYPESPGTCFLSSGTCFFDMEVLESLYKGAEVDLLALKHKFGPAFRTEKVPGGSLTYIEEPKEGEEYVIGADASQGLPDSDPCGGAVLRKSDWAQVAWAYGKWKPEGLAKILDDLGRKYRNALLGVESNNHGHSCLNTLVNVLHYPNLYYDKNERGNPGPGKSGKVGFNTNPKSRQVMLDDLELSVREGAMKIRDLGFITECMTFKLQADGQYSADPGAHDDKVIMWAVARQMLKFHRHKARVIII